MWNVLPKLLVLRLLVAGFAVIILTLLVYLFGLGQPRSPDDASSLLKIAATVITPATVIFFFFVWLSGKFLWKILWHLPILGQILNKKVCPNLNGKWTGHFVSTYRTPNGERTRKDIELKVQADFFGLNIDSKSGDRYSLGKIVQGDLYRDPRTNAFYLSYIFEGNVPLPEESDDRKFDGAARLEIIFDEDDIRMEGTYWTNRAWQRDQNTAGFISITRNDQA